MNYILGTILIAVGAFGLWRNKIKFSKEVKKDGVSFFVYLLDGLLFGTSAFFLLVVAIGFAFMVGFIKIQ